MEIVAPLSVFAGTQNQPYPEVESSPLRNEGVYYNPFSDTLGPSDRYLKYSGMFWEKARSKLSIGRLI